MLLENPSSNFLTFTILFCILVAIFNGVLAFVRPKIIKAPPRPVTHVFTWLNCAIFVVLASYYSYLSMTSYTGLQLSKDANGAGNSSITAIFAFVRSPLEIERDQLESIAVKQEWTQRKHGPENWYRIIIKTRAGQVIEPNWSISAKNKDEYTEFAKFVDEMKNQNLPLSFSYKDEQGRIHSTQSITERPNQ